MPGGIWEFSNLIVNRFQLFPKIDPGILLVTLEFGVGEREGKYVDREGFLSRFKGAGAEGPDFFDGGVAHRKTADGDAGAVDHQSDAGAAMVGVEGVWIAEIKGEVKAA